MQQQLMIKYLSKRRENRCNGRFMNDFGFVIVVVMHRFID